MKIHSVSQLVIESPVVFCSVGIVNYLFGQQCFPAEIIALDSVGVCCEQINCSVSELPLVFPFFIIHVHFSCFEFAEHPQGIREK